MRLNTPVVKILIYTDGMLTNYLVFPFITTKLTILDLKTVLLSTDKASLSVIFGLKNLPMMMTFIVTQLILYGLLN